MKIPKRYRMVLKDLFDDLDGIQDDIDNVGKDFYMYDRFEFLKQPSMRDDINNEVEDTDRETIKTLVIRRGEKHIIMNDENGRDIRTTKPITEKL